MRRTSFGLPTTVALIAMACNSDRNPIAPRTSASRANESAGHHISTEAACGATIVTNLRLEADLTCIADGLIVGADGIMINLNGHTIAGAGVGLGINVRSHQDIVIRGGTIRGFLTGIMVATSTGVVIKDNGFTQNREAVFLAGAVGNMIKHNNAWQNTLRGIMIRPTGSGVLSTDNIVMDNTLTNNPSGILLFGQPGNTLKANTISRSTVAGIDLTGGGASANVIKDNLLTNNAAGVKFGTGWTGNEFIANTFQSNTCGVQGGSTGNTFKENVFTTNSTDWCP